MKPLVEGRAGNAGSSKTPTGRGGGVAKASEPGLTACELQSSYITEINETPGLSKAEIHKKLI